MRRSAQASAMAKAENIRTMIGGLGDGCRRLKLHEGDGV